MTNTEVKTLLKLIRTDLRIAQQSSDLSTIRDMIKKSLIDVESGLNTIQQEEQISSRFRGGSP